MGEWGFAIGAIFGVVVAVVCMAFGMGMADRKAEKK